VGDFCDARARVGGGGIETLECPLELMWASQRLGPWLSAAGSQDSAEGGGACPLLRSTSRKIRTASVPACDPLLGGR
jgi:hypothetical protein